MTTALRGSRWSLSSEASLLSNASTGSALSTGSVGSFLSAGSIGSAASLDSAGSPASIGSLLSAASRWSVPLARPRRTARPRVGGAGGPSPTAPAWAVRDPSIGAATPSLISRIQALI
jgi:hypothetical protein